METKPIWIVLGLLALLFIGIGIGHVAYPTVETVNNTVLVPFEVSVPYETIVERIVTVEVEVPVETTTEVDNGNLDYVLQYIYDNDGDVDFLVDDLDDDEVSLIVDRVVFLNDITAMAKDYAKNEAADELNKEVYTYSDNSTITFDDDDVERVRVNSDVTFSDLDFEDYDGTVTVTIRFEQDDDKFEADFEVTFKDYEIDDIDLVEIRER